MNAPGLITPDRFDAVLFDLDGVLTATAKVHAASWKEMFDSFLRRHSAATGEPFQPFDLATDYFAYVDGRPRFEGVRAFLASRRIVLPEGSPADPPKADSILSLGNRKNVLVQEAIAAGKVELFPGALPFVDWVLSQGLRTAVVSSSKNCRAILAAGLLAARTAISHARSFACGLALLLQNQPVIARNHQSVNLIRVLDQHDARSGKELIGGNRARVVGRG